MTLFSDLIIIKIIKLFYAKTNYDHDKTSITYETIIAFYNYMIMTKEI